MDDFEHAEWEPTGISAAKALIERVFNEKYKGQVSSVVEEVVEVAPVCSQLSVSFCYDLFIFPYLILSQHLGIHA